MKSDVSHRAPPYRAQLFIGFDENTSDEGLRFLAALVVDEQ